MYVWWSTKIIGILTFGFWLGKYYLVDSAYPNILGYMSRYKSLGVWCHMPKFTDTPLLEGKIENFNYCHSSLRSTIEHTFGVLKATWKILEHIIPPLKLKDQIKMIFTSCTLHNMICLHQKGMSMSPKRSKYWRCSRYKHVWTTKGTCYEVPKGWSSWQYLGIYSSGRFSSDGHKLKTCLLYTIHFAHGC